VVSIDLIAKLVQKKHKKTGDGEGAEKGSRDDPWKEGWESLHGAF